MDLCFFSIRRMGLKERIRQFISSQKRLTEAQFEREVGLSQGAVQKIGEGTRQSTLDKISTTYPQLSMVWLRTGAGSMLNFSDNNATEGELMNTKEEGFISIHQSVISQMTEAIKLLNETILSQTDIIRLQQEQIGKMQEEAHSLYLQYCNHGQIPYTRSSTKEPNPNRE